MPATAMDLGVGPSNNSPVLVADPGQPKFVVLANRIDAPDFGCALQLSGDGGRTWIPANPVPKLPEGAEKCYGPEVAFDRQGVLYYLFVGLAGGGNQAMGVYLTTSSNRGRTFSPPRQILGQFNFGVRMAIDRGMGKRGRLHLVWLRASSAPALGAFGPPPNPVMAAYSDDGGRTFSQPVQVSDPERERVVGPALTLGPHHQVDVAYYDLGADARDYQNLEGPVWEGNWTIVLARSTDGGRHFGRGVVVDDAIVPPERPILIFTMTPPGLVTLPKSGEACLAWTDARQGDADVLLRCSTGGVRGWRPPVRLNDDRPDNGTRQFMPRLGVSSSGRIDAVFLDRRADPRDARNDLVYTYSSDGGLHFSPNLKVTRVSSNAQIGAQYAGPSAKDQYEIGSRLGLLSRRSDALAAWPDTRNQVRAAAGTGQDIYTTDIRLPSAGSSGAWFWAAGAVMVAGGAAVAVITRRPRRVSPTAPRPQAAPAQ
jgi:hypothetical protein